MNMDSQYFSSAIITFSLMIANIAATTAPHPLWPTANRLAGNNQLKRLLTWHQLTTTT